MPCRRFALLQALVAALALVIAAPASANHKWANNHWARPDASTPINLAVNDGGVANSWQKSTVLGLWTDYASPEVPISLSSGNKPGDIDITAASGPYGFNGWLGLATLALDRKGHIDWATVKLNETYARPSTSPLRKGNRCTARSSATRSG